MKKFFLALSFLSGSALAGNHVTLYLIPSPLGLDWSSPKALAWSALKNRLKFQDHSLGQVWTEVTCGERQELTGMVPGRIDYFQQLFLGDEGLGLLRHSFEGKLEEKGKVYTELETREKTGGMSFIKVLLNQAQCERALTFIAEYRKHDVGRSFGFALRPRHAEGGSSAAFGVSVLDVLNLVDQEMQDQWSRTVNVPLDLAGPPLGERGVSLFKIFFSDRSWARDDEKHTKLTIWDSDKMMTWVKETAKKKLAEFTPVEKGKALGLQIDKSQFPAPLEPIWQQKLDPKDPRLTVP